MNPFRARISVILSEAKDLDRMTTAKTQEYYNKEE